MRTKAAFILIWVTGLCAAQAQSAYEPLQERRAYLKAVSATPEETTGFKPGYHNESEEDATRQRESGQTIFLTIGGFGTMTAVGFEYFMPVTSEDSRVAQIWSVKSGFGTVPGSGFPFDGFETHEVIPLQATYNAGWEPFYLEAGVGSSYVINDRTQLYLPIGLRQQSDEFLLTVRIFRNIRLTPEGHTGFAYWGMELGYSF